MKQESMRLNESHESQSINSDHTQKEGHEVSRLKSIIQKNFEKKEKLGVHFSGVIQSAHLNDTISLTMMYVLRAGKQWEVLGGQTSGISQRASCQENRSVWNFPFNITYETKTLTEWPQLYVVLYRTDYFGRSMAEAYGNVHLPRKDGNNKRKIRLYKLAQPKSFWNCLNFCSGSLFELKQPEKNLGNDKNRSSMIVSSFGEMNIEVYVKKINFSKHGYE